MAIALAVLFALPVGSFLTVVADRVPAGRSILNPRSACDSCGRELAAVDLVPVLSWLLLRGRCRTCGARIGPQTVIVELACAGLWAALAAKFGMRWVLVGYCVFVAGLIALTAIDIRTHRLPREITYATAALGVPFLVVDALVREEPSRITNLLLGAVIALVAMGAIYVASRGGMGDGDVRLAPLLGGFTGWLGLTTVPIGLFLGFFFGAVVGVAMMAGGKAGRKTALPFGPFLAAGAVVAIFAGHDIARLLGWV
jgi:leader peptidase (prepilin peptidase)/N-methyltransferase